MLTAIQISLDPVLLQTRGAVLRSAGLRVLNAGTLQSAMESISANRFDLAILCHSLARTDRLNLAAALRLNSPAAPLLLVADARGALAAENTGMDAVLDPEPHRLLSGLWQVLHPTDEEPAAIHLQKACL